MHVIIIRHGKAEEHAASGRDVDRALTPRGVRQAGHLARELPVRWPVSRVISSDAIRARQTGEVVARAIDLDLEFDDRLRVDRPVEPVIGLIAERAADPDLRGLVLVGHNPQLGMLVARLALGGLAPAVVLKTGTAVVLELDPTAARDPDAVIGSAILRETVRLDDGG